MSDDFEWFFSRIGNFWGSSDVGVHGRCHAYLHTTVLVPLNAAQAFPTTNAHASKTISDRWPLTLTYTNCPRSYATRIGQQWMCLRPCYLSQRRRRGWCKRIPVLAACSCAGCDALNSPVFTPEDSMEAADARRESAPYGRACKNCVRAKCRCLVRDAGTCER